MNAAGAWPLLPPEAECEEDDHEEQQVPGDLLRLLHCECSSLPPCLLGQQATDWLTQVVWRLVGSKACCLEEVEYLLEFPLGGPDVAATASSHGIVLAPAVAETDYGACLQDLRFVPQGVVCLVEGSNSRRDLNGSQCCLLEICPDGQKHARVSMLETGDELQINRRKLRLVRGTPDDPASPTRSRYAETVDEQSLQIQGSLVPPLLLGQLQSGGPTKGSPPASAGSSEDETGLDSESAEVQPTQQHVSSGGAALPPPRGVRGAVSRAAGAVASLCRRRQLEQAKSLRPPPTTLPEQEASAKASTPEVVQHQEAKLSAWASHVQTSSSGHDIMFNFTPPSGTALVVAREPQSVSDLGSSECDLGSSEDGEAEEEEDVVADAVAEDAAKAVDFDEGWAGGRCGAQMRIAVPLGHRGAHGGIFERTLVQCCWRCSPMPGFGYCCKTTATDALITPRATASYLPEDLDPEALHPSIGPGGGTGTSIAKALGGLARLRDEGVLSEADFRIAQARLQPR